MPDLCPRIQFKITDGAVEEVDRIMGIGSLDQVLDDLRYLEDMGSAHVTLDRYVAPDLEATTHQEVGLKMLTTLAERLLH